MITKDKKLQYSREYYQEKKPEIIAQKKEYRDATKKEVLVRLGGKCHICGYDGLDALSVTGMGASREKGEGYVTYWNRLFETLELTNNLKLICANCKSVVK